MHAIGGLIEGDMLVPHGKAAAVTIAAFLS
jgi:hypothetical protein